MPYGNLSVTVVAGRNLKNKELFGKMDPYCKVKLGQNEQRTKTHSNGGKTPVWEQELQFNVIEGHGILHVECWDDDAGSDDCIGKTDIALAKVFQAQLDDEWFTISGDSGKPHGELRLVLRFKPDAQQGQPQSWGAPVGLPPQQAGMPPPGQGGYGGYPPQQQYGMPPQQQYGMPPQQQYGMPPQQQYGMPPQQQQVMPPQEEQAPPPQEQQAPPPQPEQQQEAEADDEEPEEEPEVAAQPYIQPIYRNPYQDNATTTEDAVSRPPPHMNAR